MDDCRTLTSPVTLLKCLKSIKEHAFEKSPYPVIITLEDHLTPSLQAKVAEVFFPTQNNCLYFWLKILCFLFPHPLNYLQMVTGIFGDTLFYPQAASLSEFPSPESLKYRIIISTKPPKEYLEKDKVLSDGKESSEEETSGLETPDLEAEEQVIEE